MLVKRRKRDVEKDSPFGVAKEVGRKVAVADKAMEGWKQPPTEKQESIDGKVPAGQELGYHKGKDIKKEEV